MRRIRPLCEPCESLLRGLAARRMDPCCEASQPGQVARVFDFENYSTTNRNNDSDIRHTNSNTLLPALAMPIVIMILILFENQNTHIISKHNSTSKHNNTSNTTSNIQLSKLSQTLNLVPLYTYWDCRLGSPLAGFKIIDLARILIRTSCQQDSRLSLAPPRPCEVERFRIRQEMRPQVNPSNCTKA